MTTINHNVPMYGYGGVVKGGEGWKCSLNEAGTIRRLWLLLRHPARERVYEIKAQLMFHPDYCGGMILSSPRMDIMYKGGWNQQATFVDPGGRVTDNRDPEFATWGSEWYKAVPTTEEVCGYADPTDEQMTTWADEVLARNYIGALWCANKRHFSAADKHYGRLTQVLGHMEGAAAVAPLELRIPGEKGAYVSAQRAGPFPEETFDLSLSTLHRARNPNSGNEAHQIIGLLSWHGCEYDDEDSWYCEDCDEYVYGPECESCGAENTDYEGVSPNIRAIPDCLRNPSQEYLDLIPRYIWRNG